MKHRVVVEGGVGNETQGGGRGWCWQSALGEGRSPNEVINHYPQSQHLHCPIPGGGPDRNLT